MTEPLDITIILVAIILGIPFVIYALMIYFNPDYRIAQLDENRFVIQKNEWDINGSNYMNKKEFKSLDEAKAELKKIKEFNKKYPKYWK